LVLIKKVNPLKQHLWCFLASFLFSRLPFSPLMNSKEVFPASGPAGEEGERVENKLPKDSKANPNYFHRLEAKPAHTLEELIQCSLQQQISRSALAFFFPPRVISFSSLFGCLRGLAHRNSRLSLSLTRL
jgi:hypothetical protein